MTFLSHVFRRDKRPQGPEAERIAARFELAHTLVDFAAAAMFIIGSILFFFPSESVPATWFFTIGSVCFAMKPTLKLWREIRLYRMGDMSRLARKVAPPKMR
ncbi:YrhK family protein [Paracoccus sp. TK19116]|uniref:YrhK family protein n=1 Tax=Paracoccus albicereus TaxID=2922394 RepID=A0ABT1MQV3_9RHOB|nr:YrhK family protein [Paracoccus albicereus]MCQ0970673.1 YrhK family protein [Paracoccus albicereus]